MKKIVLSMMAMLAWGCGANAQAVWSNDSVSMGTSSSNDVFYSMSNGNARVENNKNWHLAFTMNAGDSSAIWANHNSGNSFVKVYNTHKDSSQWNMISLADTANEQLYNDDLGWYQGALNNKPGVGQFDFGWGKYDPTSHNIIGDSIFLIKTNNTFYKVWIKELVSTAMQYTFKVGNMTTNMDTTYIVSKQPNYANNLFAHFNLVTGVDTNREPAITAWDILFTRYTTADPTSGPMPNNAVIGVLRNKGVKIAKAAPVLADTAFVNYPTYIANWVPTINGVGFNWKTYDQGTNTWSVEDSTSYFVQDVAGNLWQLQFTGYSGSATGNINFGKRLVVPTAVNDITSIVNNYSIYPNPAQNNVNVVIDTKESSIATITIYDFSGKIVSNATIKLNAGLNAYQVPVSYLATGNYILSVKGNAVALTEKITIKK